MLHISNQQINLQARRRSHFRCQGPSEFEIQAFLYFELRRLGYNVRGEVGTYHSKAKFDLVIYDRKKSGRFPLRIIEVKKQRRSREAHTKSGSQIHRYYEDYGVPVDLVGGMDEAESYLKRIVLIVSPE